MFEKLQDPSRPGLHGHWPRPDWPAGGIGSLRKLGATASREQARDPGCNLGAGPLQLAA